MSNTVAGDGASTNDDEHAAEDERTKALQASPPPDPRADPENESDDCKRD